jgi:mutator protein MutT
MELRLNANAIITNNDNKILIIKLKKGPFKGKFCIPGGGIEPGETFKDAIKREIFEETGINLNNEINHIGFCEIINYEIKSHRVVIILHAKSNDLPVPSEEGEAEWVDICELENMSDDINPFTKEALKIWKEKLPYFKIIEK